MFVYIRSFDVESRSGQRAVVIVVADIATVVVDVSNRPRKYTMRYELELSLMKYIYIYMIFSG